MQYQVTGRNNILNLNTNFNATSFALKAWRNLYYSNENIF